MDRWKVMLGCCVGLAVSVGPIFWLALGLYLRPMTAEFGWSRTDFAAVFSVASIVNAITLPLGGYLVDRFGPPRIILVGFTLLCAAYASFSLVTSYSAFIALACFVAAAGCLASYPAYLGLPPRWFDKNLGLSLAVASSGIGAGAALFPFVINASLQASGWRHTFVLVGAIAFGVGLINFLLFIRDNKGAIPAQERRALQVGAQQVNAPFREALRTADFWLFSIAFGLVFLVTIGINFHFAALLGDRGGSTAQAASAVAALGIASFGGRLLTGALLDRFPVRIIAFVFFVGQAIGCVLLLQNGSAWAIPAAVLLGAAQGAELDMMPFVVSRRFGRAAYSQIYGTSYAVLQIGQITSPIILATIFDKTGSYTAGLMIYPALSILALGLIWFARVSSPTHGLGESLLTPSTSSTSAKST